MSRSPLSLRVAAPLGGLFALILSCHEPTGPRADLAKAASSVTVTAATPDNATQGATLDVEITGTGFDQGSRVDFLRDGVVDPQLHVNRTTYRTSSSLTASLSVAVDAVPSRYDVMVTTSSGKKGIGTERFAVAVPYEQLDRSTALSASADGAASDGSLAGALDFNDPCPPYVQPAIWTSAGALTRLPLPGGTCAGRARDINSDGVAVGTAYTSPSQRVSMRWALQGGVYVGSQIPALPGGNEAGARSVNSLGTVSATEAPALWTEAAGWRVAATPSGFLNCGATALNDVEQLAASCQSVTLTYRAFYWSSVTAAPVMLPLPSGATGSWVSGMNGTGMVVGYVQTSIYQPIRWTQSGGGWTFELLPHLGQGGRAYAVNDAGLVVGIATNKNGTSRPVFWTAGGSLRMLGTSSRGEGGAFAVSEGPDGVVIGGKIVTGKSVTDFFAARWKP